MTYVIYNLRSPLLCWPLLFCWLVCLYTMYKMLEETFSNHCQLENTTLKAVLLEETFSNHCQLENTTLKAVLLEETFSNHCQLENTTLKAVLLEETSSNHCQLENTTLKAVLLEETFSNHCQLENTTLKDVFLSVVLPAREHNTQSRVLECCHIVVINIVSKPELSRQPLSGLLWLELPA